MNTQTEKTPLEEYTGLSKHELYDTGSGDRRPCIWKIGDMVQSPSGCRSRDSGCYGKIVKIQKDRNDEKDSSNYGDTWWTCFYQVMGPESKTTQIGKIWGMRDYCFHPYKNHLKKVKF